MDGNEVLRMERTVKIVKTVSEKVVEAIDGIGGGGGRGRRRTMHHEMVEYKRREGL